MLCPPTKPICVQSSSGSQTVHLRKMVIGLLFALNLPWNTTINIMHAQLMSQIAWSIKMLTLFFSIVFQELDFQTSKRKCKLKNEMSKMYGLMQKCSPGCYTANYHTFSSSLHLVCQVQRQFSSNSNNSKWYKS